MGFTLAIVAGLQLDSGVVGKMLCSGKDFAESQTHRQPASQGWAPWYSHREGNSSTGRFFFAIPIK